MTTFDRMTAALAAARLSQATAPRNIPAIADRAFVKFAQEVAAESGVDVLNHIVQQVRQHADLTRGRAA
ncbi:hypothetical protein [Nocardioides sp. SLBN-35]|uniref:hypothetical protein n=1 Tax=Nocardioides sp. SLBN-35 TaxID=2768445 RepID=UPI0011504B01|nr:hypothetical protein [Nocardioides sp. SLBN-35]TQK68264.1 hypothetical protein FBY23_0010 [Nocardioides sp. SLBN-35]